MITDLGVLDVAGDGFHLVELAPDVTAQELVASTAAPVRVAASTQVSVDTRAEPFDVSR